MKLVSMEKSKETMSDCAPISCEHDKYPYGLRIHLDEECLAKLGIKELPKVGEEMYLDAKAIVCDVSENMISGTDKTRRSLGLQICALGFEEKEEIKKAADALYDKE